jgi:hypothetical protein
VADPAVIELIPDFEERLLVPLVAIARIPVVREPPVWDRLKKVGRLLTCGDIAIILILHKEHYLLLPGDIERPLNLFHDAVEYRCGIRYTPEGEDTNSVGAESMRRIGCPPQVIHLPAEFIVCRIDIGRLVSDRSAPRQGNLVDSRIEN